MAKLEGIINSQYPTRIMVNSFYYATQAEDLSALTDVDASNYLRGSLLMARGIKVDDPSIWDSSTGYHKLCHLQGALETRVNKTPKANRKEVDLEEHPIITITDVKAYIDQYAPKKKCRTSTPCTVDNRPTVEDHRNGMVPLGAPIKVNDDLPEWGEF